ncbi:MAG: hypothetical protein FWD58_10125 [Firmicutes bacterium]|nr:hypothetical protein [Bacillota bacterium]
MGDKEPENKGKMSFAQWVVIKAEISSLKKRLEGMDYKTSKYTDGEYKQKEWSAIVGERQELRQRIRDLCAAIEDSPFGVG